MKYYKADVEKIVDTVDNVVNPFEHEQNELIHIASGVVATQDVHSDLQTADARGKSEFTKFCLQHLQTGVNLFSSIAKMNLKTFTSMSKKFRQCIWKRHYFQGQQKSFSKIGYDW